MPSPIKQSLSTTKSKSPPKNFLQKTSPQTKKTTLANIPDDVLSSYFYKKSNLKMIMNMYSLNKSFNLKKKNLIDIHTLDLSNLMINAGVIKFINDNINKLEIKKIILDKNLHYYQINNMYYELEKIFLSQKVPIFDIKILDLTNVTIDTDVIIFIDNNINKSKIKKLILDSISFENDEVFNEFILSIRLRHNINYYKNVNEVIINNFVSIEGKYFITLIENIGFFSNLKKLTITNTHIINEVALDIDVFAFAEIFVTMLEYLEKLEQLIFDYNYIRKIDIREITKGVRKINKRRRIMKLKEIKPYEFSNNIIELENS